MKKLFIKYHFLFEVIFILIVGLTPLLWYKNRFMGLGHDMGFPLAPMDHFKDKLFIWTDRLGPFGSNQVQVLGGIFIHGLEAFFSFLGLSLITVQKITYIFWFVLPGLTMYILLRSLYPEKKDFPVRISGSLFYMMNHYLLEGWTIAERTKFSLVAAIPIVVLLIIRVVSRKDSVIKNSLLLALTLFFLNGGNGVPLFGGLLVIVLTITVTLFLLSKESFFSKLKRLLSFVCLSSILLLLLNAYWILPLLKSYDQAFGNWVESGYGIAGIIAWSQGVSANTSWIELFKLRGIPEWYGNLEHPYANIFFSNPVLIFLNLIFPIIAFTGFLRMKNVTRDLFDMRICFLLLLLIAIPLSAGSHTPLGGLYDLALGNVPGFAMFRSAIFKFGMVIWFAFAYLIAVGLREIIDWLREKYSGSLSKFIPGILLGAYIIGLFVYNYPFLNGVFFNYSKEHSTMVKVPDYIFKAKNELDSNKFSTRTFYLPELDLRTKYIDYDWGFFSLEALQHLLERKSSMVNGILAQPNEYDLLTSIFTQYSLFGTSDLIRFLGADKTVIQNDFISPDYMENPLTNIKESFRGSNDFTFSKSIGKWDFYSTQTAIVPLIYSPERIMSVSSASDNLYLATRLPDDKHDYNSFFWLDSSGQSKLLKEDIFNRYVIQAICADCPVAETYPIYATPSKILIPGNKLYEINKAIGKVRKVLIGNPNAKINIILSDSATLIGNLGLLAQYKEEERTIKIATNDLSDNLEEIKSSVEKISDPKSKEKKFKEIRYFLNYFVSNISQWKNSSQSMSIASDMTALENKLLKYIAEIDKKVPQKAKVEVDNKLYKYDLTIPLNGTYNIYLYSPLSQAERNIVFINGQSVNVQKLNSDWYGITKVPLEKSTVRLEAPKPELNNSAVTKITDFKMATDSAKLSCKQFKLNEQLEKNGKKFDPRANYKIVFRHNKDISNFKLQLVEENEKLALDDAIKTVYPTTILLNKTADLFETTANYVPSASADDLQINICLEPSEKSFSIDFSDFSIYSLPVKPVIFASAENGIRLTSPDLEFVTLNQTKYLIKVKEPKDKFILNFNSRFDSGWSLREVDYNAANNYFIGNKKDFLRGKATEYERRDNHIITDLVFRAKSNQKFVPEFQLNGFSNGWVILPSGKENEEKIFLLEYNTQNDFYKYAGVSLISLVAILSFYLFKYVKK